jgi:hypothetical protein
MSEASRTRAGRPGFGHRVARGIAALSVAIAPRGRRALRVAPLAAVLVALSCLAPPVGAAPSDASRLESRLPASTAASVREILDQAAAQGLPTAPLVATALEGAARGAPADRIVAAVRAHVLSLRAARQALDSRSTDAEIVAGASVIRAGVPADSLARLRVARAGSIVVPLVVMADMVARGVPASTASGAVLAAALRGAVDTDLMRLREHVAQDIRDGASPREAALVRTQAFLTTGPGRLQRGTSERPRAPRGSTP